MSEAIRFLHRRIENQVWAVLLPWLENNKAAHKIVTAIDNLGQMIGSADFWVRSLLAASVGLWLGIGIGMIIAVLN